MSNKNIYYMNLVAAIFWCALYALHIFDIANRTYGGIAKAIIIQTVIYGYLIVIPAFTAYVIKTSNQQKLNSFAKYLNYSVPTLIFLEVALVTYDVLTASYEVRSEGVFIYFLILVLQIIFFLIPSIINIRVLKVIGK